MSPSQEWPAKWREKIRTSQEITHYLIDGRTLPRIDTGVNPRIGTRMKFRATIALW
ncbi:MAG TPA: hypothetical protein VN780_03725 [Candidatus Eisenbacteria bacterium]|jgi:hypothetical protein|nr:hypothetical protein [Candidatus Eisenbacteria bacterium]